MIIIEKKIWWAYVILSQIEKYKSIQIHFIFAVIKRHVIVDIQVELGYFHDKGRFYFIKYIDGVWRG